MCNAISKRATYQNHKYTHESYRPRRREYNVKWFVNREFQKQLVLPKSFENVEMLFNKLPSVVAVAIMDGIMLNCEILRLWHLEFSNIELNEKWSNSHALWVNWTQKIQKKAIWGNWKLCPALNFCLNAEQYICLPVCLYLCHGLVMNLGPH